MVGFDLAFLGVHRQSLHLRLARAITDREGDQMEDQIREAIQGVIDENNKTVPIVTINTTLQNPKTNEMFSDKYEAQGAIIALNNGMRFDEKGMLGTDTTIAIQGAFSRVSAEEIARGVIDSLEGKYPGTKKTLTLYLISDGIKKAMGHASDGRDDGDKDDGDDYDNVLDEIEKELKRNEDNER